MLKYGFLANTTTYMSTAHTDLHIARYLEKIDLIFKLISEIKHGKYSVFDLLNGPVSHSGFMRLN